MQKTLFIIVGIAVIAAGAWYFISPRMLSDKEPVDTENAVAVVNEETLSRNELETLKSQIAARQGLDIASFDAETKNQFEERVVQELIAQALLRQSIDEAGVIVSEDDVDAQISAVTTQLGGEEGFRQALAAEGLSEEELRTQIRTELAAQTYLEQTLNLSSVSATDEEVEAAYAQAAAQDEATPALSEVRGQVERLVIERKQQALLAQFIQQLRAEADVEILL